MLVFGWRTALLAMASVQVALVAAGLLRTAPNPIANRSLAALLIVIVGLFTPFMLGFAGFYDAFPWLSFAPFAVPLAIGPLAYAYTHALATGRAPRRFWLHLTPAAMEFAYQSACFSLPMEAKAAWNARVHEPLIDPVVSLATLVGLAAYCIVAMRLLRRYRAGLKSVVSDEARYAASWLSRVLAALIVVLAVWSGYQLWEFAFGRLSYFNAFGLYLILAALALYLAIEGWRHAGLDFPRLDPVVATAAPVTGPEPKDWSALGERWAARTRGEGWWRDSDLTLPRLAALLGTNTHSLSRALNEGLGLNFAAFVNRQRARAVAAALDSGRRDDLLTLALDAGFSSKASFNRAFKAEFGQSPSDYRRLKDAKSKSSASEPNVKRAAS